MAASSSDSASVERQTAAIRALRDVEIEQLRTMMRLLRSYFTKEQQQEPVLQVFSDSLQNLSIRNGNDGHFEVHWKETEGNASMEIADEHKLQSVLLQRLSTIYPGCGSTIPSFGGFDFSNKTVKTSVFGVENLQIRNFALEDPSDTHPFELQDGLQTPSVSNQRLSVGMTPKTLRLPKPGEMLLSVHGSPLGVYKEENMEAIQESEDR